MSAEVLQEGDVLRLRNAHVELVLGAADGAVREIWNRRLQWNFKTSPGGAWPLSYWIRHPIYPWWGGKPRHLPPCPEEFVAAPEIRTVRRRGSVTLVLDFPELAVFRREGVDNYPGVLEGRAAPAVQADRELSGISARVEIRLDDDADYFLWRVSVDSRKSRCDVIRLGSGWGGALRADDDHAHEHLAAPEWYGGAIYDNPHAAVTRRELVGKPMVWPYIGGSQNSLTAGWVDLYGRRGGLGLGYLGKSGQVVAFEAGPDGDGLSLNWRTFDLSGVTNYFGDHGNGWQGLYPLEAGRRFTSDWWIVAPHEGDWHRMADIYRQEFGRTFANDCITADTISPAVRAADFILPVNYHHGVGGRHLDTLPAEVQKTAEKLGIGLANCLVWVIGTQTEGFDTTFPDFFPMHSTCGGDAAAQRAFAELEKKGLAGAFVYTNPNFNHIHARLRVPKADTGVRANHGNFACFAAPEWTRMWMTELVPALLRVGACGIQIDQWPLLFGLCRRKGHGHKTDTLAVLRGQVAGKNAWIRAFRDACREKQPNWFFFAEAGSDATCRLVDVWSFGNSSAYHGGRPMVELTRFTHPQFVISGGRGVLDSLINGYLIYVGVGREGDFRDVEKTAASPEFREYRRVRAELRAARAPGFPHGFRDTLGLTVGADAIQARAYTDVTGITVVYHATQAVQSEIKVFPTALGHPDLAPVSVPVNLEAGQAFWWSCPTGGKSTA